jgi:hypothetical protein
MVKIVCEFKVAQGRIYNPRVREEFESDLKSDWWDNIIADYQFLKYLEVYDGKIFAYIDYSLNPPETSGMKPLGDDSIKGLARLMLECKCNNDYVKKYVVNPHNISFNDIESHSKKIIERFSEGIKEIYKNVYRRRSSKNDFEITNLIVKK